MYSYVCVRSCMFYLCSILNAAIYTPKQTNGIQYGNYTGKCKRTEGKGSGKRERGKGEQTFSQAFHSSAFKCFFLELPPLLLLLCPRLLSSCRMQNSPAPPALSIGNPMIHFHSRLPPSMATPCGTKHYYLFPSLGHNLPKSWQHDGQRRIVSPNWQSGLISSLSLQPLHPLQARHTANSS